VGRAGEMSGGRVERRLAAILAADVAGYSRLMGEDEEGALRLLIVGLGLLGAERSSTVQAAFGDRRPTPTGGGIRVRHPRKSPP